MSADPEYRPKWENRRRAIFGTLFFCAGVVVYLLGWGQDTRLHETIALGVIALGASVLLGYVFGAVVDDKNVLQAMKR